MALERQVCHYEAIALTRIERIVLDLLNLSVEANAEGSSVFHFIISNFKNDIAS
jgi:hypothetical protein